MSEFFNYALNGALLGLLYALVAMGFVVIYRASKVFNFAQGEMLVSAPTWSGGRCSRAACRPWASAWRWPSLHRRCSSGWLIERMLLPPPGRRIGVLDGHGDHRPADPDPRPGAADLFGPQSRPFPIIFPLQPIIIGDVIISRAMLYGGALTILIGVFLSWFFNRTRVGLRMTAVAEDHQVAMSLGISVQRSIAFAWLLGAMLSTMGAMVHLSGRSINMLSSDIGMAALPVALLAGLESLAGLLLAGVVVGIVQGLASAYLDPIVGGAVGSVLPFVLMLLVLLIRPTGMFGWKTIERV
jgi:branched-chain amino acid transport system permease protein